MIIAVTLIAESNPVNEYVTNPGFDKFSTAWNFCAGKLAEDSTQINIKILMANLALMEANRIAKEVNSGFVSLNAGSKFQYANLLLGLSKFEEAILVYDDLNLNYPNWSCPWRHKGEALYNLKRFKDAEVSFQKSIDTNPNHYDAYVWMAKAQYQMKKYKPALKNVEKAMTLNPEEEESSDEEISDKEVITLHEALLKKTGKKK